MFVNVYFMFPETAGKPLEEVVAIFEDPNGIKYVGTPAWKTSISTARAARVERGRLDEETSVEKHVEGAVALENFK